MPTIEFQNPKGGPPTVINLDKQPSAADIEELEQVAKSQWAADAQQRIATVRANLQAIPTAPDSEGFAGYMGGLAQNFKEAGQDIARGPSELWKTLKTEPARIGQSLNQMAAALEGTTINRVAPVGAPRIGMGGAEANKVAAAPIKGVTESVTRAGKAQGGVLDLLFGSNSFPEQVIESFAQNPMQTTAAIAGGFEGVGGALGSASKVAAGRGALGLSNTLEANAASARFFGDPLKITPIIKRVTDNVSAKVGTSGLSDLPPIGDYPAHPSAMQPRNAKGQFDGPPSESPATVIEEPPIVKAPTALHEDSPPVGAIPAETAPVVTTGEHPQADRVGSINLDRMNLSEAEKAKVKEVAEAAGLTIPGAQSNADTVAMGRDLGVTLDTLRQREPNGRPPENVDSTAYKNAVREIHTSTAQQAAALEEIYKADPTPDNLQALTTANENLALAATHHAALAKKSGQDLQAFQIQSDPFIAAAEGDLFRQPVTQPAAKAPTFRTRAPKVISEGQLAQNKFFTADEVTAAKARIAARLPENVKDFAKQFIHDESGYLDLEHFRDFTIVGGAYVEAGLRTFAEWAARMKADYPELVAADLQALWAATRGEIQSRTGVGQSPKLKSDVFVDQYAQKHGRENAAGFVADLMDHTGDTSLVDKLVNGKTLTPDELRAVRAAEENNSRKPGAKNALSPGQQALKDAREFVNGEKAAKPATPKEPGPIKPPPTDEQKLARTFRARLGAVQGNKFLGAVDPDVLRRMANGAPVTPAEYQAMVKLYEAHRSPRPAGKGSPAVQDFNDALREHRKIVQATTPKAPPSEEQTLMRHLAQRLTAKGAQALRTLLKSPDGKETIFNKLATGKALTQDEERQFAFAFTQVKQPRAAGARTSLSETLTDVVKRTQDVTTAQQQKAALMDWTMRKANVKNEVLKTLDPARVPAFTQALAQLKDGDLFGLRKVMNSFSHDKATMLEKGLNLVGSARSLVAGGDISNVGRQGGILALANPRLAAKSLGALVQALKSEKMALQIDLDIRTRPNAELYKKHGLALTTVDDTSYSAAALSKREESYANSVIENLPGIGQYYRATERANVTFLNRLRADSFDMFVDQARRGGKSLADADYKALAEFINDATGRSTLPKVGEQASQLLSTAFFSPRFTYSRFRIATGAPLLNGGSAVTRGLIARTYLQYAVSAGTMITLGKMMGADVNLDPRSAAFLKLKFGPVTVDLLSGLGQTTTFLSRMATNQTVTQSGQRKSLDGKGLNGTRLDVATRFARSKAAPVPGTILDLLAGKDYLGRPITPIGTKGGNYLDGEIQKNVIQMSIPDVVAAAKEQGIPAGTAIAALNLVGIGVNYQEKHH